MKIKSENKINKYKKMIDNYDYISFDIFDTLITRNLNSPTDIFEIVQSELEKRNIKILNFKNKRIDAEIKARKISSKFEIDIDEIYDQFEDWNEKKETIKEIEIDMEISFCEANKNFIEIYNYCLAEGKRIIITSDMYLKRDTIEKILSKNGIKYEKLFLSSELNMTKQNGNIYKYILEQLKITNKDIIHFGDNIKSDYLIPKKLRINAALVKNSKKNSLQNKKCKKIDYLFLKNYINNTLIEEKDYFWKVGYQVLGPLLYAYSQWLKEKFNKENYNKILFLSRDGLIMKNAYEIVNLNSDNIEYMYASRRALIIPTLYDINEVDDVFSKMFFQNQISLKAFLKKIGLEPLKFEKLVNENGYSLDDIINPNIERNNKKFKLFLKNIENEVIKNSKIEFDNLERYLKNIGFQGKIAIVDIGWFGNMQVALINVVKKLNLNAKIDGYYLGIVPNSYNQLLYNMKGFLFEKGKNEVLYKTKKYFNSLIEIFFTARHGSVKRFSEDKVEFYDYEYENTDTDEKIKLLQEGAIEFVKSFNNYEASKYIKLNEISSFLNFIELGNNPSKKDLKMFENIKFYDDDFINLLPTNSLFKYILNLKKFLKDFRQSPWRIRFFKKSLQN